MSIQLVDNFQVNLSLPIDNRIVASGSIARDAIPYKYDGLRVFDTSNGVAYVWYGGTWSGENATSITGAGTANYLAKYTTSNTLGDSVIFESAGRIGINTTSFGSPAARLQVNGPIRSVGTPPTGGFYGNGMNITSINATNITDGTLTLDRLQLSGSTGHILVRNNSTAYWESPSNIRVRGFTPSVTLWGQSFDGTNNVSGSISGATTIEFGNSAGKSTLRYLTNQARILDVPALTGDRTFAFINEPQTFTGMQTFNNGIHIKSSALIQQTSISNLYVQLTTAGSNVGLFFQNAAGVGSARSLYMDASGNLITGGNSGNRFINFKLTSGELTVGQDVTGVPSIRVGLGGPTVPSYSFWGDSDTGMYRVSDNILGFATGGIRRVTIQQGSATDIVIYSPDGTKNNGLSVYNATATLQTAGNFYVNGNLNAASKSFKISHPLAEKSASHYLVHSCIEGPKADNIYRGTVILVNGKATINLDEVSGMTEGTFVLLNRNVQCFTTNETGWNLTRGKITGNLLEIESENNSSDEISWLVIGERHDKEIKDSEMTDDDGNVIVEPPKPF